MQVEYVRVCRSVSFDYTISLPGKNQNTKVKSMNQKSGLTKGIFLCFTPLVTSSLFAVSPSLAATFASSEAQANLDNFSHIPLSVSTLTDTNIFTVATDGQVTVDATAFVRFTAASLAETEAENLSLSVSEGEGSNYFGLAQSFAELVGYEFQVGADETFAFDFNTFLQLETSINDPSSEQASSTGSVDFELYDSTDTTNLRLLDFFNLSGIVTSENSDFLDFTKSSSFSLNSDETSFDTVTGDTVTGTEELAKASVSGKYSRTFKSPISLTLVETKINQTSVQVPESSSLIGLLSFGLLCFGYGVKTTGLRSCSKLS